MLKVNKLSHNYLSFQPSRHTKLEKADILEMAVKHLQNVQRQQLAMAMASDPTVLRKFKAGFNECASEIDRYMGQIDSVESGMKQRVSSHLSKCIGGIEQVAQMNFPGISNLPFLSETSMFNASNADPASGDQNNNPRIQIPQGIHLIPSRLPTGELALLVPNSSKLPYFPTAVTAAISRPSAFASVLPHNSAMETVSKPLSPPVSPVHHRTRSPSPHGFRPVLPTKRITDDHQVPQVSSTVDQHKFMQPFEVKTLKYPIHKYTEKESPKKPAEPLCIITNQAERYKQAHMLEESANFEENLPSRGVKRKAEHEGLLTFADDNVPAFKVLKTESSSRDDNSRFSVPTIDLVQRREEPPTGSRDGRGEGSNDMWRPW